MKYLKIKQIATSLLVVAISFAFTQCKNTTKGAKEDVQNIETKTKNEVSKTENEAKTSYANDKMYFDYKIDLAKISLDIEDAKAHFILDNDKTKAEADLDKAEKHLSKIEKYSDNDYHNFTTKMKSDIKDAKQSIKNDDKTTKGKLEELSNSFSSEISKLDAKVNNEKTNISADSKRHYAELRAKEYLLKAKLAVDKKETYAKADEYLDKADKEYVKAKQYGSEKYKANIEDLRKDIKSAKKSIQAKGKDAKKEVNKVITKLGSYSEQTYVDYPYIIIP